MLKYLLFITLLFLSRDAFASDGCDSRPGEYLLRFGFSTKEGGDLQSQALMVSNIYSSLGVTKELRRFNAVDGLVHVKAPDLDFNSAQNYVAQGLVKYIEPNCIRKIRRTPDDPRFSEQWGLRNSTNPGIDISAVEAWNTTTGSSQIVVGIVDSGVDIAHQDLANNIWINSGEIPGNGVDNDGNGYVDDVNGYNFVDRNGNVEDQFTSPHGTSVAGIIGAVGNNGIGTAGVAWNVKLLPLKIFTDSGGGDTSIILEAWQYAIDLKNRGVNIRVINNSFGSHGEGPLQAEVDLAEAAGSAGILLVFSAGNDGASNDLDDDSSNFPLDNVITVASIDRDGELSDFSNFGEETVDVAAPGDGVLAPMPNNQYGLVYGTSFSAPYLSGIAVLGFSFNNNYTPAQIRTNILGSVKRIDSLDGRIAAPGIPNASSIFGDIPVCSLQRNVARNVSSNDGDGDGVSNSLETTDGTDPNDRGSFKDHLESPIYLLWNGFLEMTPIVELVNPNRSTISARVSLFDIGGSLASERIVNISARGQRDIIVPELVGFERDTYGLIKIEFCGGKIDGRTSYYRQGANGSYDFAYSIPFATPTYGETFVGFNTFQPSINPADSTNIVANWLSIVNLATTSKGFTVYRYRDNGELINVSREVLLPSQRRDLDGGHGSVGPNNVGLIRIVPDNKNSPYIGILKRFGHDSFVPSKFHFAYPLQVKAGSGRAQYVPVTTTVGAQNWLEVVNVSSRDISVAIKIFDSAGSAVYSSTLSLGPREQRHLNVNSRLGEGKVGYASIVGSQRGSVIAQSMVYVRNGISGSIEGMYGSQTSEALGKALRGSYNLFLDMFNWLKLINVGNAPVTVTVKVEGTSGTVSKQVSLAARSSTDLGLHEVANYGTATNSFGLVEVTVPTGGKVLSELVRLRVQPGTGSTDFAFPTAVREAN